MSPSSEIEIGEMQEDEYDALIALWKSAGLPFKAEGRDSRDRICRELHSPQAFFLVARHDGRLAGSVLGTHDGRKGWINRLAVHPEYRRRHVARMLIDEVEKRLEAQGIEVLAALVEGGNTASLSLMESAGYRRHDDITYFSKRRNHMA